jgi:hypothetical protein
MEEGLIKYNNNSTRGDRYKDREKSWTELPNILGDRDTIENLCSMGDEERDFAAMGCVAAAFQQIERSMFEPTEPKFLYPTSREYPFDETTYKIVKALEERGFDVPGINVKFDYYGPNDAFRHVEEINAEDFRLLFCRIQGELGNDWNDTAAVNTLNIPKKELSVFEDNSGPNFHLYVGKNWEADKDNFLNNTKVNSKLRGEPRKYLRYDGSWRKEHGGVHYLGKTAPFLANNNDLGREYDAEGKEPRYFETQQVFQEFKDFLDGKLEQIIKSKEPVRKEGEK